MMILVCVVYLHTIQITANYINLYRSISRSNFVTVLLSCTVDDNLYLLYIPIRIFPTIMGLLITIYTDYHSYRRIQVRGNDRLYNKIPMAYHVLDE